jgi:hypothetical protein
VDAYGVQMMSPWQKPLHVATRSFASSTDDDRAMMMMKDDDDDGRRELNKTKLSGAGSHHHRSAAQYSVREFFLGEAARSREHV